MTHIIVEDNGRTLHILEATVDDKGKLVKLDIYPKSKCFKIKLIRQYIYQIDSLHFCIFHKVVPYIFCMVQDFLIDSQKTYKRTGETRGFLPFLKGDMYGK